MDDFQFLFFFFTFSILNQVWIRWKKKKIAVDKQRKTFHDLYGAVAKRFFVDLSLIFVDKNCGAVSRAATIRRSIFMIFFFQPDHISLLALADDRKFIADITPNQVRGVGESVDLSCTVDESANTSPFWFKRSRDRQTDPSILTTGSTMAFNHPRMNISRIGNTFVLTVSRTPIINSQRKRNMKTIYKID